MSSSTIVGCQLSTVICCHPHRLSTQNSAGCGVRTAPPSPRSAVPGVFCAGADLKERRTMPQEEVCFCDIYRVGPKCARWPKKLTNYTIRGVILAQLLANPVNFALGGRVRRAAARPYGRCRGAADADHRRSRRRRAGLTRGVSESCAGFTI